MTNEIKINWFDDGCAEIICICGEEMMVGSFDVDDNICDNCGRKYVLIQDVKLMDELKAPNRK